MSEAIKKSGADYNEEKIKEAFYFAAKAHDGQFRKSGEPYICHPVEVAKILIEYGADDASVIAALLHDTVEDTEVTLDDIKKTFGEEIALLVDGVTKLDIGKISYASKEDQQIENIRKMLLAMTKDIRVILIKLADRLHNMRTLSSQDDRKKREKSLETLEVYSPLAHRLGLQSLKSELEDISLQYLDPVGYKEISEYLEIFKNNSFFEKLKHMIEEKLKEAGIKAEVEGRIKHIYSIYRKMFTQNKEFNEIYDLYAFRIIVDRVSECYNALGLIHDIFHAIPGRLKDYIATPKPNMYQSLHTTVSYDGYFFEVQIRTKGMHRIAEMGIAAHWKYKDGVLGKAKDDANIAWVRKLLEIQQDANDDDFMKTFKIDLFADQCFVSTPKGDIISLPAGANPIDFAYSIHSEVGNKMVGAKINGRIAELTTPLHNGDVVEILTSANSNGPSRDWINLVKTSEAKNKIKQWFKREKREENIVHGRESLDRELRRLNINFTDCTREDLFAPLMKKYNCPTLDEFYAAIGYGGIAVSKILPKIKTDYNNRIKQSTPLKIVSAPRKQKSVNGIIVEGIDNCLVRLARCCVPLPGDKIVGFVTRGYGVSVHRADCKHILSADPSRIIKVSWDDESTDYFTAVLTVETSSNNLSVLSEITTVLSSSKINLRSLNTKTLSDGNLFITLTIEVHSLSHLETIAKKIERLPGVASVKR
ncbi:MAG: bifunctional (p)ppGpp synthetase/guanosine-3',5'-bis(diphosphate) 3'-pyrophosphohydrolase [Clostridiales bacterium]|nr:bifunctional (p)ppGpp synthetase/guanosine-3',5'-bis(diphosphate) 3'-pyrophosphohydrolase [Clostridiales bacterium]